MHKRFLFASAFRDNASKVLDFAKEVVGDKVFLVCNSVGGVVGLQAGVDANDEVGTHRSFLCAPEG